MLLSHTETFSSTSNRDIFDKLTYSVKSIYKPKLISRPRNNAVSGWEYWILYNPSIHPFGDDATPH